MKDFGVVEDLTTENAHCDGVVSLVILKKSSNNGSELNAVSMVVDPLKFFKNVIIIAVSG